VPYYTAIINLYSFFHESGLRADSFDSDVFRFDSLSHDSDSGIGKESMTLTPAFLRVMRNTRHRCKYIKVKAEFWIALALQAYKSHKSKITIKIYSAPNLRNKFESL